MCAQNLKSVALHVPELIVDSQKLGWFLAMPLSPPPKKKSYMPTIQIFIYMCTRFPEIFDCGFKWGCQPPTLGKGGRGGQGWYRSKERW